jgi:tRNA nucleotidyltransferase (CCA-adding enzyme)
MNLSSFFTLARQFEEHGYRLWLVGGSTRDYFRGVPLQDFDCATDATPDEMRQFLSPYYDRFAQYGHMTSYVDQQKFDITTLRIERYERARHPKTIEFIKDPTLDYVRRDFTMNALYLDHQLNVLDFCQGQDDIKAKRIKMIGDPLLRFKEDPIRMVRAIRFAATFTFTLDAQLADALSQSASLLSEINPQKLIQEVKKIPIWARQEANHYFEKFKLYQALDVL